MYFVYNPDCTQLLRRRKSCKGLNGTQWPQLKLSSFQRTFPNLFVSFFRWGWFWMFEALSEYRGVYIFKIAWEKGKNQETKAAGVGASSFLKWITLCLCIWLFSCWMELDWAQHCLNLFRICLGLLRGLGVAQQIFHFGWNHWLPPLENEYTYFHFILMVSINFTWTAVHKNIIKYT